MTPFVVKDHEEMSRVAADMLAQEIEAKPTSLLCLATGATPMRAYELLAAKPRDLFSAIRVIKLDEWGGIPMTSPATCETFLRKTFVDPLDLSRNYVGFDSQPKSFANECQRIAGWLKQNGPIDICALGLGVNGHLGFNEPAPELQPHAHVATLSKESLQHTMIAAEPKKPTSGVTLGIADILQSKKILVVVSGASKREPMQRMLSGQVTTNFPATFLSLHPNVTIICDHAAAFS